MASFLVNNFFRSGAGHPLFSRGIIQFLERTAVAGEIVVVDHEGRRHAFKVRFSSEGGFSLEKQTDCGANIDFLITSKNSLAPSEKNLMLLYRDDHVGFYENSARFENNILPLRFGLSESERNELMTLTHRALNDFFSAEKDAGNEGIPPVSARLSLPGVIGVALWHNGKLRGSMISFNEPLFAGVASAAQRSLTDDRFKPFLTASELSACHIEITHVRSPFISIHERDWRMRRLYPEKAYRAQYNNNLGFLFPEVLNIGRVRSFYGFMDVLLYQKLKIKRNVPLAGIAIELSEVDDFVAPYAATGNSLLMEGVTAKRDCADWRRELQTMAVTAAEALLREQKKDGSIPAVTKAHPLDSDAVFQSKASIVTRQMFSGYALALYGKERKDSVCIAAGGKILDYILNREENWATAYGPLVLVYGGFLSQALGRETVLTEIKNALRKYPFARLVANPITAAQTASFLQAAEGDGALCAKLRAHLIFSFKKHLWWRRQPSSLAYFAEMANVFSDERRTQKKIFSWLKHHQLPDGSFRGDEVDAAAYTRGTSKILEVLALEPEANEETIAAAIRWLATMQYKEGDLFHTAEEYQRGLMGGFRHDYYARETWSDATGHLLIAAARLTFKNKV